MSSRRTKCDPEKETSQLMYEARMQYVTGHVDASVSTQDTSIWTIQIPEHLKPRQKVRMGPPLGALKGSGGRRPRTAPEGSGGGGGGGRGSNGRGTHFGSIVQQAMFVSEEQRSANALAKSLRASGGTIQLNFASRVLPLERRLEMKRAENKMKMMAEIAKQKRRSTFSSVLDAAVLRNQRGAVNGKDLAKVEVSESK